MQKKLREHANRLTQLGKPTIEVRVHRYGEVVMRAIETGGRLEYTTIGRWANLTCPDSDARPCRLDRGERAYPSAG